MYRAGRAFAGMDERCVHNAYFNRKIYTFARTRLDCITQRHTGTAI